MGQTIRVAVPAELEKYDVCKKVAELNVDAWNKGIEAGNAGLDVFTINPVPYKYIAQTIIAPSCVAIDLPEGLHLRAAGRSGMFFKNNYFPFEGVIDSNYRGHILVGLIPAGHHWMQEKMLDDSKEFFALKQDVHLANRTGLVFAAYKSDGLPNFEEYFASFDPEPSSVAVAQLVFLPYKPIDITEFRFELVSYNELTETNRGDKGFGSSDKAP